MMIVKKLLPVLLIILVGQLAVAQNCYIVKEENSGIDLFNVGLEAKACMLQDMINVPSGGHAFQTFGYDFYPIQYYAKNNDGFDNAFMCAFAQIDTMPYYLLITKEHHDNGHIKYRTRLKLPDLPEYEEYNVLKIQGIERAVNDAITQQATDDLFNPELSYWAEMIGIDKLKGILSGTDTFDPWEPAGFTAVPFDSGVEIQSLALSEPVISSLYCESSEIQIKEGATDVFTDLKDLLPTSLQLYNTLNLVPHYIFSSDENSPAEIDALTEYFESTTTYDFVMWFHFSADMMYAKVNVDEGAAFFIVEGEFTEEMGIWGAELTVTTQKSGVKEGPTEKSNDDPWGKQLLEEVKTLSVVQSTKYGLAIGCGVLDGLLGTLKGAADLGQGMVEGVKNGVKKTASYFWDLIKLGVQEDGLTKVAMKVNGDLVETAEGILSATKEAWNTAVNFWNNRDQLMEILHGVKDALLNWLENFLAGDVDTGYDIGVIAFDIIFGVVTAGAGAALAGANFMAKFMKVIQTFNRSKITETVKGWLAGVAGAAAKSKALAKKVLRCKILGKGCFVKDTPVLMASNPFKNVAPAMALATMPLVAPIQDVQVDDMVKAYHHEDMYLTASNDANDIYVPGWQDYDYLDITPETWQVGKFIITEADGSVVEIEANRPKKWFEDYGLKKNGDEVWLEIEEMGVADYAVLHEIRATDIDTRQFELNEKGEVDRPVITTYKRVAQEISDYTFSNGQVISCTPNHPFYSSDRQNYIPVGELSFGETVQTASEREVKFIGGKAREKGEHVYNFEVWREHNYYVGSEDFTLVHNSCPGVKKTLVLPNLFQNWINTLKTKINPRKNYPDGKFEKHVTGDDIQYEAIGGGEKIWADGIDLNRNALVDAKHNPGDFYTLESYLEKPFLYGDLDDEFRRYAKIVDSGSNPAAELIIKISNQKESSELLFKHLGLKFKVPTSVETIPWTP